MKLGSHVNFWGTIGTASILLWSLSQSRAKPEYSPAYAQIEALPKPGRRTTVHLAPKFQGARFKAAGHLTSDVTVKKLRKLGKYAAAEPKEPVYRLATRDNGNAQNSPAEIKVAPRHLARDVTIKNLCKLRTYAVVEPKQPAYQPASKKGGNALDAEAKVHPPQLVKNVTIKNLCKLRTYAVAEPKEPAYQAASKKEGTALGADAKVHSPQLVKDITVKNLCKLRKYAAVEPKEPVYQLASKEDGEELHRPVEVKVTPVIRDAMNKVRPKQLTGTMKVEGKEYEFGSGGHGQSIPYGDYLITPGAIGSWGSRHGAIGVADGTIPDPKLHRDRDGIELHAATNDKLRTNGCVSIRKDQWPEFKKQVFAMLRENKKVYLHVSDQGASVSTNPLEFIGETISEPTVREVLSMIEGPTRKASE